MSAHILLNKHCTVVQMSLIVSGNVTHMLVLICTAMTTTVREISLFTHSLAMRRSGAPADHIQTPSLCSPLFSELSSSLPVSSFHLTFRRARAALLVPVRLTD